MQIDPSTPVFHILAVNGPDAAHPYVGAVGGSAGYYFQPGGLGCAYLVGTGHTNAGSPPSFTAGHSIQSLGYNAPAESMIWSHSGNVLLAQWTNVDGTANPTQTFHDPAVDFVGLTGDLAAFNATFPNENAFAVTLRFTGSLDPQQVPEPASLILVGAGLAGIAAARKRKQA